MRTIVHFQKIPSPQGNCIVMATEQAIIWASTPNGTVEEGKDWIEKHISKEVEFVEKENSILKKARKELGGFFNGKKTTFSGPFHFVGTPFQQALWKEMMKIPYGEVITYKEMAKRIGMPNAPRAVGVACRRNPIAILNPCHRIVGSDKSLTGYAGKNGILTKKWLLELEKSFPE